MGTNIQLHLQLVLLIWFRMSLVRFGEQHRNQLSTRQSIEGKAAEFNRTEFNSLQQSCIAALSTMLNYIAYLHQWPSYLSIGLVESSTGDTGVDQPSTESQLSPSEATVDINVVKVSMSQHNKYQIFFFM